MEIRTNYTLRRAAIEMAFAYRDTRDRKKIILGFSEKGEIDFGNRNGNCVCHYPDITVKGELYALNWHGYNLDNKEEWTLTDFKKAIRAFEKMIINVNKTSGNYIHFSRYK